MAEGDPAAVRVDVPRDPALVEPRVLEELEDDAGEGLVDLDHPDVVPRKTSLRERALARERVPVQHAIRVDAREPERDEPRAGL